MRSTYLIMIIYKACCAGKVGARTSFEQGAQGYNSFLTDSRVKCGGRYFKSEAAFRPLALGLNTKQKR